MGYPMTWQRLINRNGLADGDYGECPASWRATAPKTAWSLLEEYDAPRLIAHGQMLEESVAGEVTRRNGKVAQFAGDLRRLEHDTLDEGFVCSEIARRTDLSPDQVAAVLKEWLAV